MFLKKIFTIYKKNSIMATIISQTGPSRIWAAQTLPITKPTNFTKPDYFFQGSDEKTYIWVNNKWELSPVQFPQQSTSGNTGTMPTISVDSNGTTTLAPGSNALVENIGTQENVVLKFSIPKGDKGDKGDTGIGLPGTSATVSIGGVSTTTLGPTNAAQVIVTDSDNSVNNAVLNFDFKIPRGGDGSAATIGIGSVTTLPAGSNATVTNAGTSSAAVLNFGIPRGADGVSGGGGAGSVGGVRYVTNFTELQSAWAGLSNGSVRSIHLAGNINQTAELVLPANYSNILEIDGHGFDWNVPSTVPNAIRRTYASLAEANSGIDLQLRMKNVSFKGNSASNGINLHASYGSKIEGCRFYNFKTAFYGGWTMGTIIDQCFFWENNISIELDYARFTNGSNSASQSNHSIVTNCKFRHSSGQFGAIKATAVSGLQILHNIFEGVQAGPQYEVYFNDESSNVVKEVHIYGNHVEQAPSVAAFYVRLKDGNAYVGGIYSQYDCTLIQFDSSAYAKMNVENIPYLTSGTKFENINSAGRWAFKNLPVAFDPATATYWKGTAPVNSKLEGWIANGQTPTIKLAGRSL